MQMEPKDLQAQTQITKIRAKTDGNEIKDCIGITNVNC